MTTGDRKAFDMALGLLSLGNGLSSVTEETGLSRQTLIRIRAKPEKAAVLGKWGM